MVMRLQWQFCYINVYMVVLAQNNLRECVLYLTRPYLRAFSEHEGLLIGPRCSVIIFAHQREPDWAQFSIE